MGNPLSIHYMLAGDPSVTRYNYLVDGTQSKVSISVAGSADVTLTEFQASHYQITLTGAITANIAVKVPQKEHPYVFINATTGAFTVTVLPVTSGTGPILSRGMYLPLYCDGTNVLRHNPGMAVTPFSDSTVHFSSVDEASAQLYLDSYFTSVSGSAFVGRHARGNYNVPAVVTANNNLVTLTGQAWARDAGDISNAWIAGARIALRNDSVDAQNRIGGAIGMLVSPGVSASLIERATLTESGQLYLGNPSNSGTDRVMLSSADILGVAGNNGLQITDETGVVTSIGKGLLTRRIVEANTAGSGTPNALTADETYKVLTNEGTTVKNYHTLPTAAAGLVFTFVVQDADGIRVVANTADTVRLGANVSGTAGYAESTTIGDTLTLQAINATEWIATSFNGTWVVSP